MEEDGVHSGDFLKDVEINITLRSGSTDLVIIRKLLQAIVASAASSVDTKVVTTGSEVKVKSTPGKNLIVCSQILYIE